VPKRFPPEFQRDVVRVARRGDLSQTEVAADFDVSVESVRRWVRQADVDDGIVDGRTSAEQNELVQLRREKRRLEMENETSHASVGSTGRLGWRGEGEGLVVVGAGDEAVMQAAEEPVVEVA
jgi:transposase